jgi:hypothetical protein
MTQTGSQADKIAVMHNTAQNSPGGRVFFGLRRKTPMKRRDFVVTIGSAVACSLVTNAMKDGRFGPGTERKKQTQL